MFMIVPTGRGQDILAELDSLFGEYGRDRDQEESFGDFLLRSGRLTRSSDKGVPEVVA